MTKLATIDIDMFERTVSNDNAVYFG
jgi:hypothetical protein